MQSVLCVRPSVCPQNYLVVVVVVKTTFPTRYLLAEAAALEKEKNRIYKMHAKLFKSGRIMTDCLLHARLNVYVRTYLVVCAWHYSVWKTRVCRLSARSMAMPVVVIVYLGFTLYWCQEEEDGWYYSTSTYEPIAFSTLKPFVNGQV